MRCTVHVNRQADGYCCSCGSFYCSICLTVCEDNKKYCASCMKKLRKQAGMAQSAARDARLAVRLEVHLRKGVVLKGTTYAIDPNRNGFHFIRHGKLGDEEMYVKFKDVKYVAIVESFAGGRRSSPGEYQPKGSEVLVTFKDGDRLDGYTLKHYSDSDPRFSVIPSDPNDNRLSMLVERDAIEKMTLGRIPKAQELRKLVDNPVRRLVLHFYWRHPKAVLSLDDLASRLERTPHAVERELPVFEEEGLINVASASGRTQLRFTVARDPVTRDAVASMGREIDMLYFRKRQGPKASPSSRGFIGRPRP